MSAEGVTMVGELACFACGVRGADAMARASVGREPVAELCVACFAQSEARAALAAAFVAGELGERVRLLWFHEEPDGGALVLQADRVADQAQGRALARF